MKQKEFQKRNITLEQPQMKTLGIINQDGIYTNLALLLSDQCVHTIKTAVLKERIKIYLKIEKNLQDHYLHKWKQYMITLTSEIKHIQLLKNFIELIIEIIQK